MYEDEPLIRPELAHAHATAWRRIGEPGAFWTGSDRVQMVAEARAATSCTLCADRREALSPFAVGGRHAGPDTLDRTLVDFIHRLRTDPGRMTRAVFDAVMAAGISEPRYVEVVSVVASSVIVDTLHAALGLPLPALPGVGPGTPSGELDTQAVRDGAWVPLLDAPADLADTGLPSVPNIARSLGLVPDAGRLFFGTFRPHYALKDLPLSISQSQAELVASRVSAINECFY